MATCLKERYFNECPVCLEVYVKPQILTCNHSLCKTCSDRLTFDGTIKCPLCRRSCSKKDVKPDFKLAQSLEVLADRESAEKGISKDEVDCTETKHSRTIAKVEAGQGSFEKAVNSFIKGIPQLETKHEVDNTEKFSTSQQRLRSIFSKGNKPM